MSSESQRRHWPLALVATWGVAAALPAVTCSVPAGTYPTISAAIADLACTTVVVGAGTFSENVIIPRTLTLTGAGAAATIVAGALRIEGATSVVALAEFKIDGTGAGTSGCWPNLLEANQGAQVTVSPTVEVVASQTPSTCRIFSDGFEWGTVFAWSSSAP